MNHRAVDTMAYHLERELHYTRVVTDVTNTTLWEVGDADVYTVGDVITVSVVASGLDVDTTITNITDNELTVAPGVALIAVDDEVVIKVDPLPHAFYTYKTIAPGALEAPTLERPFISVFIPHQVPQLNLPIPNSYQQPYQDRTMATVYVESPLVVTDGATQKGGFDTQHLPAIELVRYFIRANRALDVPASILADFRPGIPCDCHVAMMPDVLPELSERQKDGERHVFFVLLTYMTTTKDD